MVCTNKVTIPTEECVELEAHSTSHLSEASMPLTAAGVVDLRVKDLTGGHSQEQTMLGQVQVNTFLYKLPCSFLFS